MELKSPLNIMVITSQLPPFIGGTSVYSAGISQGLQSLGHKVTVLMRDKNPETFKELELDIVSVPTKGLVKPWAIWKCHRRILKIIEERNIQVVLFAYPIVGLRNIYRCLKKANIPYVMSLHGFSRKDLASTKNMNYRRHKWGLLEATKVIACTNWLAEQMTPLAQQPVKAVHLGVKRDIDNLATPEKIEQIQQKYNLKNKLVLLCLGRFAPRKNFNAVIRVLPSLVQKYSNLILLMVGEGPEEQSLKRIAKELNVQEHLIWIPKVPFQEVGIYFKVSDLLVTVSMTKPEDDSFETFGLVYVEANLCGIPVIGGKEAGVLEAIEDGETGLLVPPSDQEALESAIDRLLEDKSLREQMGARGRKKVLEYFNWERAAKETAIILKEAILQTK